MRPPNARYYYLHMESRIKQINGYKQKGKKTDKYRKQSSG